MKTLTLEQLNHNKLEAIYRADYQTVERIDDEIRRRHKKLVFINANYKMRGSTCSRKKN